MHSVLFIDEILRLIFEAVLIDDKQSLCCAARCCQAWKDPALDRLWRRLPSVIPLLSLLPGFSVENDVIQVGLMQDTSFTTLNSYSIRVKHIVHRHHFADPDILPKGLFGRLSSPTSARIESGAVEKAALHMCLAPGLRSLALQVGFTKRDSTSRTLFNMMSLLQGCSSLEQLSVRGYSSECLHVPLSKFSTLHTLSLHVSSLTEQSLMTASTLPFLVDFDVYAYRLSHDVLSAAILCSCEVPFFPSLEKLKIRAQPPLVALIIRQLPRNRLHSLHVDATGFIQTSAFDGLFQAMATLSLLREFTLEQALSVDESEDTPAYAPDKVFILDHFRPLSKLPLERLVLDSSLPPNLSDAAIEEMTKWWPLLKRLELGGRTALENTETTWKPKASLASLFTLARGCKHLESLVIALTLDVGRVLPNSDPVFYCSHSLASLTISSHSEPDVMSLSTLLSDLFPSLLDVTPGFVGKHEDAWAAVQAAVLHRTNTDS